MNVFIFFSITEISFHFPKENVRDNCTLVSNMVCMKNYFSYLFTDIVYSKSSQLYFMMGHKRPKMVQMQGAS